MKTFSENNNFGALNFAFQNEFYCFLNPILMATVFFVNLRGLNWQFLTKKTKRLGYQIKPIGQFTQTGNHFATVLRKIVEGISPFRTAFPQKKAQFSHSSPALMVPAVNSGSGLVFLKKPTNQNGSKYIIIPAEADAA